MTKNYPRRPVPKDQDDSFWLALPGIKKALWAMKEEENDDLSFISYLSLGGNGDRSGWQDAVESLNKEPLGASREVQERLISDPIFLFSYFQCRMNSVQDFLEDPGLEDVIFSIYREMAAKEAESSGVTYGGDLFGTVRHGVIKSAFRYASRENITKLANDFELAWPAEISIGSPRTVRDARTQSAIYLLLAPNLAPQDKRALAAGCSARKLQYAADYLFADTGIKASEVVSLDPEVEFKIVNALLPQEVEAYIKSQEVDMQVIEVLIENWEGSLSALLVAAKSLSAEA